MIRITENNIQLLCDECLIILEENIDIKNIDKSIDFIQRVDIIYLENSNNSE